jgi:glucokinase
MYLVFDIGGTKMRLAYSADGSSLSDIKIFPTPSKFGKALDIVSKFVDGIDIRPNCSVCVGLPGILDKEKGSLLSAPNLPSWVGKPIANRISEVTKCEVYLFNDAQLGGVGEALRGIGVGHRIIAYLTVGTGIGGCRVVDGYPDVAVWGFEPGRQKLQVSSGKYFGLQELAGGAGIEKRYLKRPEDIRNRRIWSEINEHLAIGVLNTIFYWSPNMVVLGGGLTYSGNISIKHILSVVRKNIGDYPDIPQIVRGLLGDKAGLFGGIEMLKRVSGK